MSDSAGEGVGVPCPFCEAREAQLVAAWGGQLMTSQMRCRACGAYFEAVREDLGARERDTAR